MGDTPVNPFRQRIERCQYRWLLLPQALLRQRRAVRAIRRRGHVRVVFLVSSLPMWRCLIGTMVSAAAAATSTY